MKRLSQSVLIIMVFAIFTFPVFSGGQGDADNTGDEIIFLVRGNVDDDPFVGQLREICDQYSDLTGTEVVFLETDRSTYYERLQILFAAGEDFDLFFTFSGNNIRFMEAGLMKDLSDLSRMHDLIYPPHAIYDGRTYSIPVQGNAFGIFYNKALLNSAGYTIPESRDEFLRICRKFKGGGSDPLFTGSGSDFMLLANFEYHAAAGMMNSIDNYTEMWREREIGFDNVYMKKAIEDLFEMEPFFEDNYTDSRYSDVVTAFKTGKVPFAFLYTSFWKDFEEEGLDFRFMGLPSSPEEGKLLLAYHTDLAVSDYSRNPEGAMDLINFLLSRDIQKDLSENLGSFPAVGNINIDNYTQNKIYETLSNSDLNTSVGSIVSFDIGKGSNLDARNLLVENLKSGLSGKMTVAEILEAQENLLVEDAGALKRLAEIYKSSGGGDETAIAFSRASSTEAQPDDKSGDSKFSAALPPVLSIKDISFSESILDAGESAVLSITLKNIGPGNARDVYAELNGGIDGLSFRQKSGFPVIEKNGGEQTIKINVSGGIDLPTATANLNIRIIEPNFKVKITGKRLTFSTREFLEPEIVLARFAVEEYQSANPNNRIDLNEIIDVEFAIQNIGQRDADRISVNVENNQSGVMLLGVVDGNNLLRKEPEFSVLKSGKYEMITYRFFVNSEFTGDKLEFNIRSNEKYGQFGFNERKSVLINTLLKEEGYIRQVQSDPGKYEGSGIVIEDIPDFDAPAAVPGSLEDAPLVSVMDFDMGDGISDAEVRMIADIMSSEIFNTRKFRVIDRRQRETVLSEIKFSMSSCNDEACQLEAGKLLSADKIVVGSISKFGEGFLINIKLIQVETGETRATSTKMCASKEELVPICKVLAAELTLY